MTILHASDLHFGTPHRPEAAAALLRFARRIRPAAIVVSGDLTQRAKEREYRAARDFLDRLPRAPLAVSAGNHDVPLYRIWERLLAPFGKYRRHIGPELDAVLDVPGAGGRPGARIVSLTSAAPRRAIVNGRIRRRQLDFAARAFARAAPGAVRLLAVHHHPIRLPEADSPPPLHGRERALRMAESSRVDLVLAGHVHCAGFGWSRGSDGRGVPVAVAGTASSTRGRGAEAGRNSVNVVKVRGSWLEVAAHLYDDEADRFLAGAERRFARRVWHETEDMPKTVLRDRRCPEDMPNTATCDQRHSEEIPKSARRQIDGCTIQGVVARQRGPRCCHVSV